MSRKKSCICGISMLIFGGFSPIVAAAEPVDVSKLDLTALRALFHGPPFSVICPLEMYGENYSQPKMIRSSTLVPSHTLETTGDVFPTFAVYELLRNSDNTFSDGLDDYDEDFTSADLPLLVDLSK